ncbi:MAG: hypothetical protein ACXWJ1_08240 [Caldimonas sp.]
MSIEISYTNHGTIRIQCGSDVVEVPYPGGWPPAPPASPPAPDPPAPRGGPTIGSFPGSPVPGGPRRSPPPYGTPKQPPAVTGVVTIGLGRRFENPGDPVWSWYENSPCMRLSITEVLDQGARSELRGKLLAQRSLIAGLGPDPMFLNVEIRPDEMAGTIDLAKMQSIVQDASLGIDGIRLVPMLGGDAG